MKNNPKKSKALIITIILIILLLIVGYFIFKNKSITGIKTTTSGIAKIFSPLETSSNSKSLITGQTTEVGNAEAGEDITQGDSVYQSGTNKGGFPIVKKVNAKNTHRFGISLGNIRTGDLGTFLLDKTFWGKIQDWIGNILGTTNGGKCINGATNPTLCTTIGGICINNATNPPLCTTIGNDTNIFPTVTVTANPASIAKGESSTISWESTNADACNAGAGNGTGKTGSFGTGALTTSRSYTVTCTGTGGTGSGNVLVIVGGENVCPLGWTGIYPVCTDPNSNSCPVGWTGTFPNCTNTGSCPVGWTGTYPVCTDPNSNICPPGWTGTYPDCTDPNFNNCPVGWTGTFPDCTNIGGCPPGWTGTYPFCTDPNSIFPEVTVTATPNTIAYNGTSTISWESKNTISCDAGNVTPAPTYKGNTNTPTTSGSFGTGALIASRAYTVTCTGIDGISKRSRTAFVFVNPDIILPNPECSDGIDNNSNGLIDIQEPNCHNDGNPNNPDSWDKNWPYENVAWGGKPQCADGRDNDGDGLIDIKDPDCHTDKIALDKIVGVSGSNALVDTTGTHVEGYNKATYDPKLSEYGSITPPVGKTQCSDQKDNDGDKLIDALDPNCHLNGDIKKQYILTHDDESNSPTQCDDTLDNDKDGKIDALDLNCHLNGDIKKAYIPTWNNEASSPTQCSDKIDNDGDSLVDIADSGCYLDGIKTIANFRPTWDDEANSPQSPDICKDFDANPLVFTDDEKSQLAELLRKFYIMAPGLKSADDVTLAYSDLGQYQDFANQLTELTKQCYFQTHNSIGNSTDTNSTGFYDFCTRNPSLCAPNSTKNYPSPIEEFVGNANTNYTGPTTMYGNPWFKYNDRGSYLVDKNGITGNPNGVTSPEIGTCGGKGDVHYPGSEPWVCRTFTNTTKLNCEQWVKTSNDADIWARGCTWTYNGWNRNGVEGSNNIEYMKEYEKILNIW